MLLLNDDLINNSLEFIKVLFKDDFSGHDYFHSLRVYKLATRICQTEKADIELVQLAAILHDTDDYKLFNLQSTTCSNAINFMKDQKLSEDTIDKVCKIINEVSFKGNDTVKPETIEGQIVQDADRLDAIGAIGIARTFAYGGSKNIEMYNPEIKPKANMNEQEYKHHNGTVINHFYEKLLLLKDMMNTGEAKRIAKKRHNYMLEFIFEFQKECEIH